jgi:hypothetical protein
MVSGQRDQRRQVRASRIAHQADALRVDIELGGIAAHVLHRRADILHRVRPALLSWRSEPVGDAKDGNAAFR